MEVPEKDVHKNYEIRLQVTITIMINILKIEQNFPVRRNILGNLSTDVFEPRTTTGNLFFPALQSFQAIAFVTSSHSHQQELFLSMARSKTTPKKETFDFRLPSVTHERLCLSSLIICQKSLGKM